MFVAQDQGDGKEYALKVYSIFSYMICLLLSLTSHPLTFVGDFAATSNFHMSIFIMLNCPMLKPYTVPVWCSWVLIDGNQIIIFMWELTVFTL